MNFNQLLFTELRLVCISDNTTELCDSALVKTMTVNEELLQLGYTLSPRDIVRLSKTLGVDFFVQRVKGYIGDVKAKPMYPDFPSQVMALDEAVFRFHQLVHYMSTYGIEEFTGAKVTRGWLPEMQDTEKTVSDKTLLSAKVISLVDVKDEYILPYRKILSKTERMDNKEKLIVLECLNHLTAEQLAGVKIPFKQNMLYVFNSIFTAKELTSDDKLVFLHSICQHTGDVWKCMDYALTRAKFHFKTSQKHLIVKLLESYPVNDFKTNLILSNKKAERTLLMLQYVDFNEYSRKKEFTDAVAAFRNGELHSWESRAKFLVESRSPEALDYYAQRPGMMLRSITYLIRNDYKTDEILARLAPYAASLKPQTLISLMSFFSRPESAWQDDRYYEAQCVIEVLSPLLIDRLRANETVLRDKKIYIDMPEYDLDQSSIRVTDNSSEGGYIRSGLAYKIPEGVDRLRFFVYWNDEQRVDVDLHGSAVDVNGEHIYIGWNADYKSGALVFSGDITHSDAAEYIDIDLIAAKDTVDTVSANIHLYSGYNTFGEIDECFVGAMAVSKTGEDVKLYDPKNCFFTHYLTGKYRKINYGYVDVQNRVIVFDGVVDNNKGYYGSIVRNNAFSLNSYLDVLFRSQGSQAVTSADEAELILVMGKPTKDNEISLIDNNFFME